MDEHGRRTREPKYPYYVRVSEPCPFLSLTRSYFAAAGNPARERRKARRKSFNISQQLPQMRTHLRTVARLHSPTLPQSELQTRSRRQCLALVYRATRPLRPRGTRDLTRSCRLHHPSQLPRSSGDSGCWSGRFSKRIRFLKRSVMHKRSATITLVDLASSSVSALRRTAASRERISTGTCSRRVELSYEAKQKGTSMYSIR